MQDPVEAPIAVPGLGAVAAGLIMSRSPVEIAAELDALALFDFDPMNVKANGDDRLHALCTGLAARDDPAR